MRERAPAALISDEEIGELQRLLSRATESACPDWPAADREDLVHTALVRMMQMMGEGSLEARPSRQYVRRVAYNQMIDEIRRRQRDRDVSRRAGGEAPLRLAWSVGTTPDPERLTADRELLGAIRSCLVGLAAARRRAVVMWLLGYGYREIGAAMEWTPKRTDNLVTRGREDLRLCLRRKGHGL